MKIIHTPVMLGEVVKYLDPKKGKNFIDATLGGAGHTLALLEKGATVVGIDRDDSIIDYAKKRIEEAGLSANFTSIHSSFSDAFADKFIPLDVEYDGILFDLGVSSLQLDTPDRGFSFRYNAPLDMRMDKRLAVTAADLVNGLGRKELASLFELLGEEHAAKTIANAICEARKIKPISTTQDLVGIIDRVVTYKGKIHKSTKVFQALRMAVNSEREELKAALPSALSYLKLGGVLAVICFQSLEDKIVKEFFQQEELAKSLMVDMSSPISPQSEEVTSNPRSRSAKLYIGRKLQ